MQILIQSALDEICECEFLTSFQVMLMLLDNGHTLCKKVPQKLMHMYQSTETVMLIEAAKQHDSNLTRH